MFLLTTLLDRFESPQRAAFLVQQVIAIQSASWKAARSNLYKLS